MPSLPVGGPPRRPPRGASLPAPQGEAPVSGWEDAVPTVNGGRAGGIPAGALLGARQEAPPARRPREVIRRTDPTSLDALPPQNARPSGDALGIDRPEGETDVVDRLAGAEIPFARHASPPSRERRGVGGEGP